jgi:hypothetical protein
MVVGGPTPTGAVFVGRDVMEWNMTFSRPVTRPAGTCVWVVANNFAAGDSVFWMDGDGSNGQPPGCPGPQPGRDLHVPG